MSCTHDNTEHTNKYYDETGLVEYQVVCVDCGKVVGHWSYGYWQDLDDDDEEVTN